MVGISIPSKNGLLVQINVDLFGLQVFLDSPGAKLSAKSGLLVAPNEQRRFPTCS
jgi:hypothetical protein